MPKIDADDFFKAAGKEVKKNERVPTRRKPRVVERSDSVTPVVRYDPVSEKRRAEIETYPIIRLDVNVKPHEWFGSEYEPNTCWCGLSPGAGRLNQSE